MHHLKATAKLLGLGVVSLLRELNYKLAKRLGVSSEQTITFLPTTKWYLTADPWSSRGRLHIYFERGGEVDRTYVEVLHEWDLWTVSVESAQDGGGTTYVFYNPNLVAGLRAAEMVEKWSDTFNVERPVDAGA